MAPAGSEDSLKAAILGGADSVYLGGPHFGARRMAENFTHSGIKSAVELAHGHGVKVYVTTNILIKDRELEDALSYVKYLESIGVDALIIQDRGLLKVIEDICLPLHASTQMGIHSPEGALWAEENGFERVILARELNQDEIRQIRDKVTIEIETFVHGALCYSYSGQCLFSSILGGRSGNRGMCAQPCRRLYSQGADSSYFLSTADLFSIDSLPLLYQMGLDAVKIEGRMRSPTYVYLATRAYAEAVDRIEEGEDELITARQRELLETVFNRGFTRGYLREEEVMQREFPDSRGKFLGEGVVEGDMLTVDYDRLEKGDGITLFDGEDKVGGFEIKQSTVNKGWTQLPIPFQLSNGWYWVYKTKDRTFEEIRDRIDSMPFPQSVADRDRATFHHPMVEREANTPDISCYLDSITCLQQVLPLVDRVYFEDNSRYEEAEAICESVGKKCIRIMPRISHSVPQLPDGPLMINTMGQYWKFKDRELYGSYFMNYFNSCTGPDLHQYTASVELSKEDLKAVLTHTDRRIEVLVFGRIELMVTRDPSLSEKPLVDQKGWRFPVYRDREGYAHILNSADLVLLNYLVELESMGVDSFGIDLRRRGPELCKLVVEAYRGRDMGLKEEIKWKCGQITSGHYKRGVL